MPEAIETAERTKCIEKNILSFLFKNDGYEENDYTERVHYKISDELKKDWGKFISNEEIDKVLSDLIENKLVNRFNEKKLRVHPNGMNYALENSYISIGDVIKYCDKLNSRQLDYTLAQFKNLTTLQDRLEEQKRELDEKTEDLNTKIASFYNNIISIMTLLIAAFSIIGFNISGIKFIVSNAETLPIWAYVGSIVVINLCIIVSLICVFRLVQTIVYPGVKRTRNNEEFKLKVRIFNNKWFQVFLVILNLVMVLGLSILLYPVGLRVLQGIK